VERSRLLLSAQGAARHPGAHRRRGRRVLVARRPPAAAAAVRSTSTIAVVRGGAVAIPPVPQRPQGRIAWRPKTSARTSSSPTGRPRYPGDLITIVSPRNESGSKGRRHLSRTKSMCRGPSRILRVPQTAPEAPAEHRSVACRGGSRPQADGKGATVAGRQALSVMSVAGHRGSPERHHGSRGRRSLRH